MSAADRGFTWSDEETALLLQLWGRNDSQSELTGNKRNFVVYEKIAETMKKEGYVRTASQCREKIKRMKREYTLTKLSNAKSGGTTRNMRFYEQFDKILIKKQKRTALKSCQTVSEMEMDSNEMDATETSFTAMNERKLRTIAPRPESKTKQKTFKKKSTGNPWTPVVLFEENASSTNGLENQNMPSTSYGSDDLQDGKKRKLASQMSLYKCIMDSVKLKFMNYQQKSDERMLKKIEELESERNAMDDKMQKMWLEFEERRLEEDRKHELNIMNTFQDIVDQVKTTQ